MRSPTERFEWQYKAAAAEGAVLELKLRLLADKVPELQNFAHDKELRDVENLVLQHFAQKLTEEEKTILTLCRQLRNKILHCNFQAARQKLGEIGISTQRGDVKKIDVRGLTGAQMADKLANVVANIEGTFEYVADSTSAPGGVFGWLLELGAAGDFVRAADAFTRGAAIVDRLARSEPTATTAPSPT